MILGIIGHFILQTVAFSLNGINMDIIVPPDLYLQVRKIRNIEVWKSNLLPLIVGGEKIPSTPINAYCELLQDSAEGCPNYIIFSSWRKDDEIVSFSLARPSIYLYIVPSLPGSGKNFFLALVMFLAQVTYVTCDTLV